jgi:hypothetical protein
MPLPKDIRTKELSPSQSDFITGNLSSFISIVERFYNFYLLSPPPSRYCSLVLMLLLALRSIRNLLNFGNQFLSLLSSLLS